jgi:1-phosphofructokinase family hexose kinase
MHIGMPVLATGFQGSYSGAFITKRIEAEGVPTSYVQCQAPTRTSTVLQVDETGDTYALYEPGQPVTQQELDALYEHYAGLLPEASIVIFCGSGQTDVLAPSYQRMIEMANEVEVPTLLDSSGDALKLGVDARPYMVKVNRFELGGLVGQELETLDSQLEAMTALQKRGIPRVALSLGEAGLIATDGKETWQGVLKVDNIINTVGCGDAQLAGITKQIIEQAPLKELVRWGVACGTANTQVRGAGWIELGVVEAMLPEVALTQVGERS